MRKWRKERVKWRLSIEKASEKRGKKIRLYFIYSYTHVRTFVRIEIKLSECNIGETESDSSTYFGNDGY